MIFFYKRYFIRSFMVKSADQGFFSGTVVASYHNALFSPLPPEGKVVEVIKRICLAILAPLAYPILAFISLFGRASKSEDVYFVRHLNIKNNALSSANMQAAVNEDINDLNNGYHKGSCLYTPKSTQPLAAFDPRAPGAIGVGCRFALMIDPKKATLHYWSLADMDRNNSRDYLENKQKSAKANGKAKFKPDMNERIHRLRNDWKTVHMTGVDQFINKVETVATAVTAGKPRYATPGGKQKTLDDIKDVHNEGVITYNPAADVAGILVDKKDIETAKTFRNNYVDTSGHHIFKNVFIAYQDPSGKIVKV